MGSCALCRPAAVGLLGLRGSLEKLVDLGLAELGDDLDIVDIGFGILSMPRTAAGSFTFSPNDSRTVLRVDLDDRIDLGEYCGGCVVALLSPDL